MVTEEQTTLLASIIERQEMNPFFFARMMNPEEFGPVLDELTGKVQSFTIDQLADPNDSLVTKAQKCDVMCMVLMDTLIGMWIGSFMIYLKMIGLSAPVLQDANIREPFERHFQVLQAEFIDASIKVQAEYLKKTEPSQEVKEEPVE